MSPTGTLPGSTRRDQRCGMCGDMQLLMACNWVCRKVDCMVQVSGFALMTTGDAKRLAQYWLKYTEDVRSDDQASERWPQC